MRERVVLECGRSLGEVPCARARATDAQLLELATFGSMWRCAVDSNFHYPVEIEI